MTIEAITLGPELSKALVAAHGELRNPKFDTENSYFHSRYASLAACCDSARPVLFKHGVAVIQDLTTTTVDAPEGGKMLATACRTLLLHESGQGVQLGPFVLPAEKPTAQALGSAATYNRRYTLNGATSLSGDDDDDGNSASRPDTKGQQPQHDRPAEACSNERAAQSTKTDSGVPTGLRPGGLFGYGKKFVDVPWNVMAYSQLEWFEKQDRTPPGIKDKCRAEMAWRTYELAQLDAAKAQQAQNADVPFDDEVPF